MAFSNETVISGGTLTASSGGSFQVADYALFDGDTGAVTLNGAVVVGPTSAAVFGISGAIVNKGTIILDDNGGSGTPELFVHGGTSYGYTGSGTATLTGGGSIVLQDNPAGAAIITGIASGTSVTLKNVNNTISGAGWIGWEGNYDITGFTLDNQAAGTINANQAHPLYIYVSAFTNEGLIEATGGGTLTLYGGIVNDSSTGKITASGTNSLVSFSNETVISGGTLTASGGGSFQVPDYALFDGDTRAVTLNGAVAVGPISAAVLGVSGSIVNQGTITLDDNGGSGNPELFVNGGTSFGYTSSGTATLTGGGSIVLQDNPAGASAIISGIASGTAVTLKNVNNTISGAGSIGIEGNSDITGFTLDNQAAGTINANQVHTLFIYVTTLTNEGLIEATGAGGLTFETSSFTNTGTITANGGNIVVMNAATGTGNFTIGGSSTLEFQSTSTVNTTFLAGSSSTLQLDTSAGFTGTITGFGTTNILDLRDFSSAGASVSYASSTGVLTITNSSASVSYQLVSPGTTSFSVIDDGSGGTEVVSAGFTPMFAAVAHPWH